MTEAASSVVIVGAGPTGLALALLLAKAGVPSTLIEKRGEPQRHPAACILNTRTMEIFREIGIAHDILGRAQDIFGRAGIFWVTSLADRELGRCSSLPSDLWALLALSPTHAAHFPQNRLEPILWARVRREARIRFLPGHECLSVEEDENGVRAILKGPEADVATGAFLVACDGAASPVREALGIGWEGVVLQEMIGIHFRADLEDLVAGRRGILYWTLNPDVFGVLIAHWLPNEWVLFAPYFPPQQSAEDFDEEVSRKLVTGAIGRTQNDIQIDEIRPWALAARLASSYRKGRVLLAGDAAHAFPPTGGFGLNTGVQDAHNLAWKLPLVLRGVAPASLLDSYEKERRPVAEANLRHSVDNYERMSELTEICGLKLADLKRLRKLQRAPLVRALPGSLQKLLVRGLVASALGRTRLFAKASPAGERAREEFRRRIPGQAPHYRSLGLDLGFVYGEGALVPEAGTMPTAADPVADYAPVTWPGARLPHLWVREGNRRRSLHDFIDGMTLLVRPEGAETWRAAAAAVGERTGLPLKCLAIGPTPAADLLDEEGFWPGLSGSEPTGAVLVRPDGHVGWISRTTPESPAKQLEGALRRILSARPPATKKQPPTT